MRLQAAPCACPQLSQTGGANRHHNGIVSPAFVLQAAWISWPSTRAAGGVGEPGLCIHSTAIKRCTRVGSHYRSLAVCAACLCTEPRRTVSTRPVADRQVPEQGFRIAGITCDVQLTPSWVSRSVWQAAVVWCNCCDHCRVCSSESSHVLWGSTVACKQQRAAADEPEQVTMLFSGFMVRES